MMKYLLVCLLLVAACTIKAQISIKGVVTDTTNLPMAYTSVVLMKASDSVMVDFVLTNEKGEFNFSVKARESYILQVSYLGYSTFRQKVEAGSMDRDLYIQVKLIPESQILDAVEIKADYSPIRMVGDTMEYNAAAFKTRPGDVVEDLLKKLPGVEVQRDGSIKAHGEAVQNVLVDGKEFFGKDTRIATKNLEADAVDKVQVFDKKSEMAEVTGIEDGRDEKTINLKLKEDRKNGYFGNLGAGGGSTERYKAKFNLNRFNPETRLSVIGNANNINEQAFSIEDYIEFMGGIGAFMSGGAGRARIEINSDNGFPPLGNNGLEGIQKTWASGLNLNHALTNKTELNVSYFFNHLKNNVIKSGFTELLNNDGNVTSSEDENTTNQMNQHSLNLMLKHKIDSFQTLIFRLGGSMASNGYSGFRSLASFQSNRSVLDNDRLVNIIGNNNRYSGSLTWQKKFRKKGRSLILSTDGSNALNENEGELQSENYYSNGDLPSILRQMQNGENRQINATARANYSEPIGKGKYLQWNMTTSNARSRVYSDFFDWVNESESIKNELLSNRFNNGYRVANGGMNYALNTKKFNLTAGLNYQWSRLNGNDEITTFSNRYFKAILPSAFAEYKFAMAHHLNADYTTRLQEPTLQQLQPIVNNTDPLNIFKGNPGLKPEYLHQLFASYLLYDQFSFTSVFARINGEWVSDKIADDILMDTLGRRTITPVNIPSQKTLGASVEFSRPIKPLKLMGKIRLRNQWTAGRVYINGEEDNTQRLNQSIFISLENRYKNRIDVVGGYKWSVNKNLHDLDESWNQQFTEHEIFGECTLTLSDHWDFKTDIEHRRYAQNGFGDPLPSVTLWKAGLTAYFMEGRKLKVTLSVFDLLNNNNGINRTGDINYYRQEVSNVLGRYFMLNFNYSL